MKKRLSVFLCLVMLLSLLPVAFAAEENSAAGEDELPRIAIRSSEEFVRFAAQCSSDLYSKGKRFVLESDLDLSGTAFSPVPWFGGVFDGGGHTIRGFRFDADGSRQGLFRIVAEGGVVRNLRVVGTVTPGGTACIVGGIAGVNRGTLENCSFEGTVAAIETGGGIVGHNTASGTVRDCSFSGSLTAEHQAAGIAGLNDGSLVRCTNRGEVNTVAVTPAQPKTDSLLSRPFDISQLSEDDFLNLSNIGGIAGDSTGIIDRCQNEGAVGYKSTGYNVGGIAGKSSGFVCGCSNTGEVIGRRDTGGIVGQLVPYSNWDLSASNLDNLSWQLTVLNNMLNELSENADSFNSSLLSSIGRMQTYTADMTDAVIGIVSDTSLNEQMLLDSILIDPATGEITFAYPDFGNVDTSALSWAVENLYGESSIILDLALDNTGVLADDLRRVAGQISKVFNALFSTVSDMGEITTETEDLSESEALTRNTGAVADCVNRGSILAENNSGGILGTCGFEVEYDMEDRLNLSDYLTSDARHYLFAAVRNCSSFGQVEAKSGGAGGIAGNMDIGVITGCAAVGYVSAGLSDYVGGLVGSSSGTVMNSWSRCLLHGGMYVGGIAGLGYRIFDCRAWTHFEQQNEYAGAVAGWAEGDIRGNLYTETLPAGIDGISLSGQTDPLSTEEFLKLEGIPAQFGDVTVRFRVDGRIIREETLAFGSPLTEFPEVENRDGMYWTWDLPEQERVFTTLTVDGAYHAAKGTLASPEDPPLFLAEGQFYEGQTLALQAVPPPPETAGTVLASWALSVEGYEGELTVRMLTPADGSLSVVGDDGLPVQTSYTRDGSYIVFRLPNGGSFVYTDTVPSGGTGRLTAETLTVPALVFGLVLVIGISLLAGRRRRKKRAAAAAVSSPEESGEAHEE